MTVEEAIRARLLTLAPLTALVSTRIWLGRLPQSPVLPAVRVSLVSDVERLQLRGPLGFPIARVQIDAYAREVSGQDPYASVSAVADAVHGDGLGTEASGLFGWIGDVGSPPFRILAVTSGLRVQRYEPEELRVLTMSRDYFVSYRPG